MERPQAGRISIKKFQIDALNNPYIFKNKKEIF